MITYYHKLEGQTLEEFHDTFFKAVSKNIIHTRRVLDIGAGIRPMNFF